MSTTLLATQRARSCLRRSEHDAACCEVACMCCDHHGVTEQIVRGRGSGRGGVDEASARQTERNIHQHRRSTAGRPQQASARQAERNRHQHGRQNAIGISMARRTQQASARQAERNRHQHLRSASLPLRFHDHKIGATARCTPCGLTNVTTEPASSHV